MSESRLSSTNIAKHHEALLRISEALADTREPQELAEALAHGLEGFLTFKHLDVMVLKENSLEIEWIAWGKGPLNIPDLPLEQMPIWHVYDRQEPLHIPNWETDDRFPMLKKRAAQLGLKFGSVLRVPLTTPHRRLGALGIASGPGVKYSEEDIAFVRLIARVVAFAIDDGLNLKRAQAAQLSLQRQNDRLQLLLNLTNRINSNLDLRELLRSISGNIREVMQCDVVGLSLPVPQTSSHALVAVDFPDGKGFFKEELVMPIGGAGARVLETLKPTVITAPQPDDFPPGLYGIAVSEGLKSYCLIPLVTRGRALGVLGVARIREGGFTDTDVEFLSQVAGQIAIAVENSLAFQEISELKDKLAQEKLYLEQEIRSEMNFEQIVGKSVALKHALQLVETVAPSDSTVLLLGETGTGKELIARAIHDRSHRNQRTFVKLNCAAIPTGLLESELFGHEKGAFTGAISQKVGRMELADRGTLFLDEVGDIPFEIQPKLLRALQEREFERLGSTHTHKVNIRLVAATNRDLEKMVTNKEFRSDLFYRLNVFPIRIPPLRERREDIPLLVSYFVQKFANQMQKRIDTIPTAVMRGLISWEWPGNIRELENFIERAVILTRGRSLEAPLAELRKSSSDLATSTGNKPERDEIARIIKETISALNDNKGDYDEHSQKQKEEIVRALAASRGQVGGAEGAAARIGLNRTTFISRMKKLGIDPRQYAQ